MTKALDADNGNRTAPLSPLDKPEEALDPIEQSTINDDEGGAEGGKSKVSYEISKVGVSI